MLRFKTRRVASACSLTTFSLFLLIVFLKGLPLRAQAGEGRVGEIDASERVTLRGSVHPLAQPASMVGHADAGNVLNGVTLRFKMSDAQQASLNALLAAQQTPSSPQFHKWLTPAQFQARFGMNAQDISRVSQWISAQGLTVTKATPFEIFFSGDVAHIEAALQTKINRYQVDGSEHLANGTQVSLPAAIANVTLGVRNLAEFRPRPRIRVKPRYTSSVSGDHYLAPNDFETIYDVTPLYTGGYTGTTETIAIVGQSQIFDSDIDAFRSASGLSQNNPTMTLVPGSGTSATSATDEEESDLDVEWSGAIAENATINFVYVGNNQNYSVFDSLAYAVENDLAPVVSISYGECETDASSSDVTAFTQIFEQANAQGETVVAASGDSGAADCDDATGSTVVTAASHGLAVDLPAASPLVTGIGGTEFLADVANPGTYWNATNNGSSGSVLSYIPEEAWNDTSTTNGLSASGGGKSTLFAKPSWQTGTGVPADGQRDVPDLALNASPDHDGYLFCSQGSCTNGFRDSSSNLTVAGGTSFGAPTFSAILTLINQKLGLLGLGVGQGNINPAIYSLAASAPTAFHDTTTGNNEVPCVASSPDCGSSGKLGYVAGVGYDQVTGWGSVDANALGTAFTTVTLAAPTVDNTVTTLTSNPSSVTVNTAVTFTASVAPGSGTSTPTGTVQFAIDGTDVGSAVTLSSGQATYSYAGFSTTGTHTVMASYSGDSTHAGSFTTLSIVVSTSSSGTASFSLTAASVTVAQGSSGTSIITVTPAGGYTGTVALSVTGPSTLTNTCYTLGSADVTSTAAATATLTINTSESACASAAVRLVKTAKASGPVVPLSRGFVLALVLLPFAGVRRFRRRGWYASSLAALFVAIGLLGLSGCGGGSSTSKTSTTSTTSDAPQGTYTLTITGTDSTAALTSTTMLTLTIN